MKKQLIISVFGALLLSLAVTGCGETVSGMGKDISRVGKGVKTIFIRDAE